MNFQLWLLATILVVEVLWTPNFSDGPLNYLVILMDRLTTKA